VLIVHREADDDAVIVVLTFAEDDAPVTATVEVGSARWRVLLDSHADRADGPGAAPIVVETADGDGVVSLVRPPRSVLLLRRA
jgi:hypothetical protein